jgi:hypothetical protein
MPYNGKLPSISVDRQDLPEGIETIEAYLGDLVWVHRFEGEFSRFAGSWTSKSNLPS